MFDIPVVLFTFKRIDTLGLIMSQIAKVKPSKIYILSDGGRCELEHVEILKCREYLESLIVWDCTVIKRYHNTNVGVYENIAGGAKWVFQREECAIFLEDDNFPELSFFSYCKELLDKYQDDSRILWVCGTNYLGEYLPNDGSSYMFTQHMLPCGWASWAVKFNKYYDGDLSLWSSPAVKRRVSKLRYNRVLKMQDIGNWNRELYNKISIGKFDSWDYQMAFSLRVHGLYGTAPKFNLIKNIGVDEHSIHGGNSFNNVMTRRFCGVDVRSLDQPLTHPLIVQTDLVFEEQTAKIISLPPSIRTKIYIARILKKIFRLNPNESFSEYIMSFIRKKEK